MRMCKEHWAMMRASIETHGLSGLIAKDGKQAVDDTVADLQGEPDPNNERFDPLMSMNWHFSGWAMKAGGLSVMGQGPESNDGHFCPICGMAAHYPDFKPDAEINTVADQMLTWARGEGLVPKVA
jgi:hypothetical protein